MSKIIFAVLISGFIASCETTSDVAQLKTRCEKATGKILSVVSAPAAAIPNGFPQENMEKVRSGSVEKCVKEGLSEAQYNCIMKADGLAEIMFLGDCPAIKEKTPTWLVTNNSK